MNYKECLDLDLLNIYDDYFLKKQRRMAIIDKSKVDLKK